VGPVLDVEEIHRRFDAAWTANDPDAIASMFAEDGSFWLHDGSEPITGRAALRSHLTELFRTYPNFKPNLYRSFYGDQHWVFDSYMTADMPIADGVSEQIRVDLVDLVTLNGAGEVLRKDTFLDGAQAASQLARIAQLRKELAS
jgi:hypothetical protein